MAGPSFRGSSSRSSSISGSEATCTRQLRCAEASSVSTAASGTITPRSFTPTHCAESVLMDFVRVRKTFLEFPAQLLQEDHSLPRQEPRARSAPASCSQVMSDPVTADQSPKCMGQHVPVVLELSTLTKIPAHAASTPRLLSERSPRTGLSTTSFNSFFNELGPAACPLKLNASSSHAALALPIRVAAAAADGTQLGSPELPTVGSKDHNRRRCRPCSFVYKDGCAMGVACRYCHLCTPEDKRKRQIARLNENRRNWRRQVKESGREACKLAKTQKTSNA